MLSPEQVARFKADGFIKGGRVVDDATVEALREELARVLAQKGDPAVKQPVSVTNLTQKADAPIWQIVNIWEASQPYRQLISNPRICEEVAQLTDATQLRVWHDQIQYKPAENGGVNGWHQDSPLWANILTKTTEVSAWVALDDVDESNGCMSMVPGSYHWGPQISYLFTVKGFDKLPKEFEGHPVEVRLCPVKKGEVHYHHALTWHGSHANASNRPRRAIAIHYMTQDTLYDPADNHPWGNHPMKQFAKHLSHGQRFEGEHFPLTWERAAPALGNGAASAVGAGAGR